jgi:hypothetical protein
LLDDGFIIQRDRFKNHPSDFEEARLLVEEARPPCSTKTQARRPAEKEDGGPVPQYYGFIFNTEDRDKFGQEAICSLKDNTIKAGTYIVTLASQALHEPEISPMRYYKGIKCQTMLVKGEDGSVTLSELTPTAIKSTMTTKKPSDSSTIYDLHGRRVAADLKAMSKGIYIIDGKKTVMN